MNRRTAIVSTIAGAATAALAPHTLGAQPLVDVPAALKLQPPASGIVKVNVIIGDRATVIDFAGPWEVFQDAAVPGNGGFDLALVGQSLKPVQATAGMTLLPRYTFENAPKPDVIMIGAQGEHTAQKIAYIREASRDAQLVMSVCTGAFLLAETGLLDGLSATTHHDFYDRFAAKFPKVHLERGPRYVEHAKLATAGGLTSGIELALRVVQRYFGDTATARTAYYMEYNRSDHRPMA
jgi:transcriptional regulator GlxA family with amidase domain